MIEIKFRELEENEQKVLQVLFDNTDSWAEHCIGFDWIMGDCNLTRKEIQKACKTLREKELVQFYRGLMTEDGEVAGSGYCISKKGQAIVNPCDICEKHAEFDWHEDAEGKQTISTLSVKRVRLCDEHYEEYSKIRDSK